MVVEDPENWISSTELYKLAYSAENSILKPGSYQFLFEEGYKIENLILTKSGYEVSKKVTLEPFVSSKDINCVGFNILKKWNEIIVGVFNENEEWSLNLYTGFLENWNWLKKYAW